MSKVVKYFLGKGLRFVPRKNGNVDIIKVLLDQGDKVDAGVTDGYTFLLKLFK